MRNNYRKSLSAAWIVGVATVALAANVTTAASWALAAGVAVTLPAIMFRLWRAPAQTMSESIQEGRR
jgi:hypothetical protein